MCVCVCVRDLNQITFICVRFKNKMCEIDLARSETGTL